MLRIRPLCLVFAAFVIPVCNVAAQSWAQLAPLGPLPSARDLHSAVYNASSNRMIVFGGRSSACTLFNDTWVLANANGTGGPPGLDRVDAGGRTSRRASRAHSRLLARDESHDRLRWRRER